MINKKFWKNKKVLITGHTGFKGGWLSVWMKHLGAKVSGYSLNPTTKKISLIRLKLKICLSWIKEMILEIIAGCLLVLKNLNQKLYFI